MSAEFISNMIVSPILSVKGLDFNAAHAAIDKIESIEDFDAVADYGTEDFAILLSEDLNVDNDVEITVEMLRSWAGGVIDNLAALDDAEYASFPVLGQYLLISGEMSHGDSCSAANIAFNRTNMLPGSVQDELGLLRFVAPRIEKTLLNAVDNAFVDREVAIYTLADQAAGDDYSDIIALDPVTDRTMTFSRDPEGRVRSRTIKF